MDEFARPPSSDEWHALKAQVELSTQAREKYVPMIERMDERLDTLHDTIGKLNATLDALMTILTPMATERRVILKAIGYVGGVLSGIGVSALTWFVMEWLKK